MPGPGSPSRWSARPSAASACGRSSWCCRRCRPSSASTRADASLPYTLTMLGFALRRHRRWAGSSTASASCVPALIGRGRCWRRLSCWRRVRRQHLRSSRSCRPADRLRRVGDLRAADRRHLALVRAPARHRGRDRAPPATTSPAPSGRRSCSTSSPATAGARPISASASSASSPCCRWCLLLRRSADAARIEPMGAAASAGASATLGLSPNALQALLCVAGVACCVAMSMPQVHIVAYCGDLGYGVARGAEMLSLMLGFGIVSRIASGFIADRIGGVATLLHRLGAAGRGAAALSLLRRADLALRRSRRCSACSRAASCRCYAIIVREYFPPQRGRHARRHRASWRRSSAWRSAAGCRA